MVNTHYCFWKERKEKLESTNTSIASRVDDSGDSEDFGETGLLFSINRHRWTAVVESERFFTFGLNETRPFTVPQYKLLSDAKRVDEKLNWFSGSPSVVVNLTAVKSFGSTLNNPPDVVSQIFLVLSCIILQIVPNVWVSFLKRVNSSVSLSM